MKYQQAQKSKSQAPLSPAAGGSSSRPMPLETERNQGRKSAFPPSGISEHVRVGHASGSDARMHTSMATEKNLTAEHHSYKNIMGNPHLPTTSSFPPAADPRKGIPEPIYPTDTVTSSKQSHGGKAGPSGSWAPSLMRISSAK